MLAMHCVSRSEGRYLLVMTENYTALGILQHELDSYLKDAVVIFGSKFPGDLDYTQVSAKIY
jgi:hypothetical protein